MKIEETYYLITYEWRSLGRHSSMKWRRENAVIKGCPGLWWAKHLEWYRVRDEAYKKKCQEYEAAGKMMPMSEQESPEESRFICATPITEEAYNELNGAIG